MAETQAAKDRHQLCVLAEQIKTWAAEHERTGDMAEGSGLRQVAADVERQLEESEPNHRIDEYQQQLFALVDAINERGTEHFGGTLVYYAGTDGYQAIVMSEFTAWQTEEDEEPTLGYVCRELEQHALEILAVTRDCDCDRVIVCLGPEPLPEEVPARQHLYKVPSEFTILADTYVHAASLQEAKDKAHEAPLPPQDTWHYLEDSFAINYARDIEYQRVEIGGARVWIPQVADGKA